MFISAKSLFYELNSLKKKKNLKTFIPVQGKCLIVFVIWKHPSKTQQGSQELH